MATIIQMIVLQTIRMSTDARGRFRSPAKIGMKIDTISIPTQREIENIWTMLGIGQ